MKSMHQPVEPPANRASAISWAYIAALSAILLIPCFWQRRIQATDLASHIYNSWLTQQVDLGKAPAALTIVPISTNVFFDLILGGLYKRFGADAAQKIAVSLLVLIFFWGALVFVAESAKSRPWYLVPCLAMFTYGWVFHMGFFNFYLAAGLSLWALALNLRSGVIPHIAAVALLLIAYPAHAIPPLWAGCVMAYTLIAQRLNGRQRLIFFCVALCGIAGFSYWVISRYTTLSTSLQTLEASGIDQVWVFGLKYRAIAIGLAVLWGLVLLGMSHSMGFGEMIRDIRFQICILMAAGILLFPTRIELPQYRLALAFITERMTLPQGVLICAFLAAERPPKWLRGAFVALASVYFSFLYVDTASMNRMENRMEQLTASLAPSDRVVASFRYADSRIGLLDHSVDRVCLGRCLSYGNYEPVSAQFRVRVNARNSMVVATTLDYAGLRDGGYVVTQIDSPLYQITLCDGPGENLCLQRLEPGGVTRQYEVTVTPRWW